MRKVNFKVRNIGSEKYLSYVLDDETDLDEELLDYLDDNKIAELIDIIYEEDDENDYLTYNITDRTTVGALLSGTVHATGFCRFPVFYHAQGRSSFRRCIRCIWQSNRRNGCCT